MQTGDNPHYLQKNKNANGSYKILDSKKLVTEMGLKRINNDDKLRKEIISNGIPEKLFGGRVVVPYDKGGSSDIEAGRLNNYFFPTQFYINWSQKNVQRMKTLSVAQRKKLYNETPIYDKDHDIVSAVFRNTSFYFNTGITFSTTGLYAPTYRTNSSSIFDNKGSCIFLKNEFKNVFSIEFLLGILCSKLIRYIQKNFIKNTVDSTTDDIKENPIPITDKVSKNKIEKLTTQIIKNQKKNPTYDYQKIEQIELDAKVYEIFGLKNNLIDEVENWFSRRYPKLSKIDEK